MPGMNSRKLEGAVGLCLRAGKCVTGAQGCEDVLRKGEALLVLVDPSISEKGLEKWMSACRYRDIPLAVLPKPEFLPALTGRENRRIAAVTDAGFAKMITGILSETNK